MASSETEIVNSALIKIGEATITSLQDDREQAQLAARQYPLKRDELLRSYRWNFAVSRQTLAPEAQGPDFGFTNRFLMPTDTIAVISIWDETLQDRNYTGSRDAWKVEGRYILANADSLPIFYIRRVTSVLEFDALFSETLSWFLAYDLAFALSTGPQMVSQAFEGYQRALRQARFADAIETKPEKLESSEWLEARQHRGALGPRIGPVS